MKPNKYLSGFLAIVLAASFNPAAALASEEVFPEEASSTMSVSDTIYGETEDGFTYKVIEGNAAITGYSGSDANLVVPSSVDGYPVTEIGSWAWWPWGEGDGTSTLESIVIPDSVTIVRDHAFDDCSSLQSIRFGSGLTRIESSAFTGCDSLESVVLPEGVSFIGRGAFSSCEALKEVALPESVTTIQDDAFYACSSLVSIDLPSTLEELGYSVFACCTSLTSVSIPEGVTCVGNSMFYDCASLVSVEIPDSVTAIEEFAFYECESLTSVDIPEGVTHIGGAAFEGCRSITSISIPSSATSIESSAFSSCGLTSVNIPEGVTSIEEYAFSYCGALSSVELSSTVSSIGSYAFLCCDSLEVIELPESVTSVGQGAFTALADPSVIIVHTQDLYDSLNGSEAYFDAAVTSVVLKGAVVDIAELDISLEYDSVPYAAKYLMPELTISDGDTTLEKDVDYTVSYADNLKAGTATVTVDGIGNYTGSATKTFEIEKAVLTVAYAGESVAWNEQPSLAVEVTGFVGGEDASTASGYVAPTVEAPEALEVGNAYELLPSGGAADDYAFEYAPGMLVVGKAQFADAEVELSFEESVYDGSEQRPGVRVSMGEAVLEEGADYELLYDEGCTLPGVYNVTVTGAGPYEGSVSKAFVILKRHMADAEVVLSESSFAYNGKAQKPSVSVSYGGVELAEGVDYEVSYDPGCKRSGSYGVTVTGVGTSEGEHVLPFEILDAKLSASNVTLSYATAAYSGSAKKPAATVKVGGVAQLKSEYSVAYWNKAKTKQVSPKLVGTYWVKVSAKDAANTSGAVWKKLTVNPKATASLKLTRLDNGFKASWTKRTVQCSGYQVAYKQAGTSAWKYKTVTGYKTNFKSVTGLKDKKSYQVKVRTFKTVNGVRYYSAYTPVKTVKTK